MRCACGLALFFAFAGLLSAQGVSLPEYTSSPEPQAESLPSLAQPWSRLDEMLAELERQATDLAQRSEQLESDLRQARSDLAELSSRLSESETQAGGLSSSLALVEQSLQASQEDLGRAQAETLAREVEVWLWRGLTALGACLAVVFAFR